MFKDLYHPQIKKDLRILDKKLLKEIKELYIPALLENPLFGEKLKGEFSGIFSYHFKKIKIEYRICYLINFTDKEIVFLMVAKRENFYKILKRRI